MPNPQWIPWGNSWLLCCTTSGKDYVNEALREYAQKARNKEPAIPERTTNERPA